MIELIKSQPEAATALVVLVIEHIIAKLPTKANSSFGLVWDVVVKALKIVSEKAKKNQ